MVNGTYVFTQRQLQCQQDPKDVIRVGSVKELSLCREKPIFHEPVGALITKNS